MDTFEKQLEIADVYAQALFELARERNLVDRVRAELEALVQVQDELEQADPRAAALLRSSGLQRGERMGGFEKLFRGKLSDEVVNTFLVMQRHDRIGLAKALLRCFVLRMQKASDQVEVQVTSAVELGAAERDELTKLAAELSGKKPVMEFRVDPELIGGVVLQIGDWRYDNSIRRQLHAAAERLEQRGEAGISAGAAV